MLYPFAWVNDPRQRDGGGGRRLHAGPARRPWRRPAGLEAIRGKIIDDCALGALMKRQGPIWLGLTQRARSLRPYDRLRRDRPDGVALGLRPAELLALAAGREPWPAWRSSTSPRRCSPCSAVAWPAGPASAAWAAMTLAFQPMLRFYRRSPLWGVALPVIGALYTAFTLQSAIDSWRGRGGIWKGRAQALETAG